MTGVLGTDAAGDARPCRELTEAASTGSPRRAGHLGFAPARAPQPVPPVMRELPRLVELIRAALKAAVI